MEPLGLSHIGLRSSNLDRAVRFYTQALPGVVTNSREAPDRRAWISFLGVKLEIAEVAAWNELDADQRRALPAPSFLVRADVMGDIAARLKAALVPHQGPNLKAAGNAVGLYFSDPDGNPFSLSCPEGYPSEGLSRNAGLWFPDPYVWAEG